MILVRNAGSFAPSIYGFRLTTRVPERQPVSWSFRGAVFWYLARQVQASGVMPRVRRSVFGTSFRHPADLPTGPDPSRHGGDGRGRGRHVGPIGPSTAIARSGPDEASADRHGRRDDLQRRLLDRHRSCEWYAGVVRRVDLLDFGVIHGQRPDRLAAATEQPVRPVDDSRRPDHPDDDAELG